MQALLSDLREHRLDAVLSDTSIRAQEQEIFDNHLIAKAPIVFAAAPALARKHPNIPKDLQGAPLILPSSPSRLYQEILDRLADWKVKPLIIADIQDVELARRMAVSGLGVVPLNGHTFKMSLPKGGLVRLRTSRSLELYESVYLVTKKRAYPNPAVNNLVRAMLKKSLFQQ